MLIINMCNKYFLCLLILFSIGCSAQKNVTAKEKSCITLFGNFISEVKAAVIADRNLNDSNQLNKFLQRYLFVHSKTNDGQLQTLQKQLGTFARFVREKDLWDHITAMPSRLAKDKYIYNNLNNFQKENSLLYFDNREPKKILGYILLIPPTKNVITTTRIWSWTLTFQFGKYMFRSVTGEDGYEYIFGK